MDGAVDGNAVALPSAGAVATFGRAPSLERPTAAARLRSLARDLSGDGDLVVDLGRDIGSANWWRGAITVALLAGSAAFIGARMSPMPAAPVPARSEEHTSELQSLMRNSYAVFCLTKKQHLTSHTVLNTDTT